MNSLAEAIRLFVEKKYVAGAVLLAATKDRVLACESVGFADIAAQKPMMTNSVFWVASITKAMTGTALMMLIDEGKVSLDDPVEKYLPEFKGQMMTVYRDEETVLLRKPKHPILVREILSHTAGVVPGSPIERSMLDRLKLGDAVRSYAALPLEFEPGTRYGYSNGGTNTAGRIIEVVSGIPYEDFMEQRLFGPLGMNDTTFWPNEEQLSRQAKTYQANVEKTGIEETTVAPLTYPLNDHKRQPSPAGGLFSTATDCAIFCQMVLSGGKAAGGTFYPSLGSGR